MYSPSDLQVNTASGSEQMKTKSHCIFETILLVLGNSVEEENSKQFMHLWSQHDSPDRYNLARNFQEHRVFSAI